jgi:UDPglucose 6-dehydrogenase
MKLSVIGCGYLGAVHAAAMAKLGHDVVGIDVDPAKIALLSAGVSPFFEPGLRELLEEQLATGRLRFSTDIGEVRNAHVHFIAVGTPQSDTTGAADLRFVDAAIASLLEHVSAEDLIVGKSTVPVGTAARLSELAVSTVPGVELVWNPEFLREGFAVSDTLAPDRLVYGVARGSSRAERILDEVYAQAIERGTPKVVTDYATAELVKVAANAFLATKISFINAMAEIADASGADVTQLADAIGYDQRIGRRFLNAGIGFGGGCLPKDIRAFMSRASDIGAPEALLFLSEIDRINLRARDRVVQLARAALGGSLQGKRVAVLGLAFKPESDDVRDSPALEVAVKLLAAGSEVFATDPQAVETARMRHPQLGYVDSVTDAVSSVDAVLVLTEWKEYRDIDPSALATQTSARVVIDGRNCLDPAKWRAAGWTYRALGRPAN